VALNGFDGLAAALEAADASPMARMRAYLDFAAATGHWAAAAAGALAALALITFAAIYTRISKPVNTALTAAAVADRVQDNARQLQARWDSVINGRVALQTLSLAAPTSYSTDYDKENPMTNE
jgi:hypothetical protein